METRGIRKEQKEIKTQQIQEIRENLSKDDVERLNRIYNALEKLQNSLRQNKADTIKDNYQIIVFAQESKKQDDLDIETAKIKIWSTVAHVYSDLLLNLSHKFSNKFESFLHENQIDLNSLTEKLLKDVSDFRSQQLSEDPTKNAFRLSEWIEKINNVINVIKPYTAI